MKTKNINHPRFITVEGMDGAGKGTQIISIKEKLEGLGFEVILTREPGGTPLGEQIRETILNDKKISLNPLSEAMLFFAARAQHLHEIIEPALQRGAIVICDRFADSSWAYQVGGKDFDEKKMQQLDDMVLDNIQPGLTFLFDLPVEISEKRLQGANKELDKIELLGNDFFSKVRAKYHQRAKQYSERFRVINSNQSKENVFKDVEKHLMNFLNENKLLLKEEQSFKIKM